MRSRHRRARKLVPIEELPEWAQPAFKGMRTLNRVQSRVHKCALFSAEKAAVHSHFESPTACAFLFY